MNITPSASDSPRLTRSKIAVIVAVVWATLAVFAGSTPFGASLDYLLANRGEFAARTALGRAPAMSPQLKILCFDDRALGELKRPELSFAEWADLLDAVAKTKPRAVYIDQMFTYFRPTEAASANLLRDAFKRLGNVTVGSFIHSRSIPFRETLPLSRAEFRLEAMTGDRLAEAAWLPVRSTNVYGPHPSLRDAVKYIGHLLYPGSGRLDPVLRVNENTAVPHAALLNNGPITIDADGLRLDGRPLPVDGDGQLLVNFPSVQSLYQSTYSIVGAVERARRKEAVQNINPGDTVVILPLFFTGNHDVVDTPIGRIPGGLIVASLLNSTLTNTWLRPLDIQIPLAASVAAAGAGLGIAAAPLLFWPTFLAIAALFVAGGLGAFAYAGVVIPWLFPVLGFIGAALTAQAVASIRSLRDTMRLKDALRGAVPDAKLKDILGNKGRLAREASERVVTLMFLDIANFSLVAQQAPPREVFLRLKSLLRDVTKTIHRYGGTVDKTLGDGLLCFFGYSYDGEVTENQADQAIRCAIEIQKANVERCLEAAKNGESMLPFRIGLNTGAVYIGDLGNEDRIDFTVIGNGVNYAQRLEAACDHHCLMVSATTMDFATDFNTRMKGFTRRFIHVKHQQHLLEAIEFDPLHDMPAQRASVLGEFRKSLNLERKELRWPIDDPKRLAVSCEFGAGALVDFSASGCCLTLPSFLAKGIVFAIELKCPDERLALQLRERGVASLRVEVRWGKAANGGGYTHGLKYLNLNDEQLGVLFGLLREVFQKNVDNVAG